VDRNKYSIYTLPDAYKTVTYEVLMRAAVANIYDQQHSND